MRIQTALFLALTLFGTSAYAEKITWNVDPKVSEVTFQATGKPGFLKINGEDAHVEGAILSQDGKLSGTLTVPLKDLNTGIDLRDEHMKNTYFEIAKFPNAILVLDETESTLDGKSHPFTGKLKLKDEEKPIKGTLTFKDQTGKEATGEAEFEVNMSDYEKLGVPNYKGVTVAKTVAVKVKIRATR